MHILEVRISDQIVTPGTGVCRATLLLRSKTGSISLQATAALPGVTAPDELRHHLLADALRQIRRLPEYRAGHKPVTLADNGLADLAQDP